MPAQTWRPLPRLNQRQTDQSQAPIEEDKGPAEWKSLFAPEGDQGLAGHLLKEAYPVWLHSGLAGGYQEQKQ
jgi:hypothetical protein